MFGLNTFFIIYCINVPDLIDYFCDACAVHNLKINCSLQLCIHNDWYGKRFVNSRFWGIYKTVSIYKFFKHFIQLSSVIKPDIRTNSILSIPHQIIQSQIYQFHFLPTLFLPTAFYHE